jgi:uncharacterized protein (DUF433 family)
MPARQTPAPKEADAADKDKVKQIGRYIVADPRICHGQMTFRGTRILVSVVLEQVASGMTWNHILDEWRGSIPMEAITEAVQLANATFLEHASEFTPPPHRQRKAS